MAEAVLRYEAYDGSPLFKTKAECEAYENDPHARLVGLSAQNIAEAIAGDNVPLGDAIEAVGNAIRKARLERGDNRRGKKSGDAE